MTGTPKSRVLIHPESLPSVCFERIGEIAYRWTMIELYLQNITWHILGLDFKRGRLLTYWPGHQAKINAFKALPELWIDDEEIANRIKSISKSVDSLRFRRNNVVHGLWGHEPESPDKLELFEIHTPGDRVTPRAKPFAENELTNLAEKMKRVQDQLVCLNDDVGAPIP